MVGKKIDKFFRVVGKTFGVLLPYKFCFKLSAAYSLVYSSWVSSFIGFVGERTRINPGLLLGGGRYITIGSESIIGKGVTLTARSKYGANEFTPEIRIGNNSSIGNYSHITAINQIIIGNNVLMGKNILITDNAHGSSSIELLGIPPVNRPLYSKGPVVIKDGVWVGEKVSILPGVTIGENAIIAANAVVTTDIPANSVAGGAPAKVLKTMA